MKFETRVVSVEDQIACLGRVIESYKGIIRVFDEDRMQGPRDEMAKDILELMAARLSLQGLSRVIGQVPVTAVSMPRSHKRRPNYDPPGQGENPDQGGLSAADVARFVENSAMMRALREISGSQAGTPAVQSSAGGGRIL